MDTAKERITEKPPRKNNEKRKEKSRDAARCRRSKETEIFSDLISYLPIPQEQISQLDKASTMRLTIAYLRVRQMITFLPEITQSDNVEENDFNLLKSLDGFLLSISADGDLIYVSEDISEYLGVSQIDLMGQNIYDYTHPCDHAEIKEILTAKCDYNMSKSFFIRMKCTLTSKGRSVNLKSATYKVVHCTGHLIATDEENSSKDSFENSGNLKRCFFGTCKLIPHPSNIETFLPRNTFLTKHSLDMNFTHADDIIMSDILGFSENDLIGKSIYDYHHASDSEAISSSFKCLFSKGQVETSRYRFLAKTGGYVWVLTQASLIYDNKQQKPQSVVCVNFIISNLECANEIYSAAQLASSAQLLEQQQDTRSRPVVVTKEEILSAADIQQISDKDDLLLFESKCLINDLLLPNITDSINSVDSTFGAPTSPDSGVDDLEFSTLVEQLNTVPFTTSTSAADASIIVSCGGAGGTEELVDDKLPSPTPITATSAIFVPRTEEMNKAFLSFAEEEPGLTMLKDEPEDLINLAPVAGDVCVPLDDQPFLSDVLEDFLLEDDFTPLLADDPSDPLIAYRDCYTSSPLLLSNTNSDGSLPSLNSPTSDSLLSEEDQMAHFINLPIDENGDLDPILKSSTFLPLNLCEDDNLLLSDGINNDLSNNTNNKNSSNLAQLLSASMTTVPNNNHTNVKRNDSNTINDNVFFQKDDCSYFHPEKGALRNSSSWTDQSQIIPLRKRPSHMLTTGTKRPNVHIGNTSNTKRPRNDILVNSTTNNTSSSITTADRLPTELLQQLISNNGNNNRNNCNNNNSKTQKNWQQNGSQKAACISQPSDSVLMNLLSDPVMNTGVIRFANNNLPAVITNNLQYSETKNNNNETCFNQFVGHVNQHMDVAAGMLPNKNDATLSNNQITYNSSINNNSTNNSAFYWNNFRSSSPPNFNGNDTQMPTNDFLLSFFDSVCV